MQPARKREGQGPYIRGEEGTADWDTVGLNRSTENCSSSFNARTSSKGCNWESWARWGFPTISSPLPKAAGTFSHPQPAGHPAVQGKETKGGKLPARQAARQASRQAGRQISITARPGLHPLRGPEQASRVARADLLHIAVCMCTYACVCMYLYKYVPTCVYLCAYVAGPLPLRVVRALAGYRPKTRRMLFLTANKLGFRTGWTVQTPPSRRCTG